MVANYVDVKTLRLAIAKAKAQAIAEGRATFTINIPCKNGHLTERRVGNSHCIECENERAKKYYYADQANQILRAARWNKENPERHLANVNRWNTDNRDQYLLSKRRSNKRHSAEIVVRVTTWQKANPEKIEKTQKAAQERRKAGLSKRRPPSVDVPELPPPPPLQLNLGLKMPLKTEEEKKAYILEWERLNPEKVKIRQHALRARRREVEGSFTDADIEEIWARQNHKCAVPSCPHPISGEPKSKHMYHIDHIYAIFGDGPTSNWPHNLQILCGTHNRSKGYKDPVKWAKSLGLSDEDLELFLKQMNVWAPPSK